MTKIRTLLVEDEPLGRERLRTLLESEPDVEIIGECDNGVGAVAAVVELAPDLLFLDVQLPELDGFEVLERVRASSGRLPVVIFTTAFYKYAIRAFEIHAIDYLLKPYDAERLHQALERAREELQHLHAGEVNERLLELLGQARPSGNGWLERFVVRSSGRIFFLKADEVDWIEADSNYLKLHVGKSYHLIRGSMQAVEKKLDPGKFMRIHRSVIVNISRIQELQSWFHGEYKVILRDGTKLTLSRGYRDRLQAVVGE
jgi:two-component system LytT family response regulator